MEKYFLLGIIVIGLIALFYWNYETEYEKECKKSMIFEMYIVFKGDNITSYHYNEDARVLLNYYSKNLPKIKYVTLKYIDKKNINVFTDYQN